MLATKIVRMAATAVASGVAGALLVDSLKKGVAGRSLRSGTVAVVGWGLRGKRSAEAGAESMRLAAGDVIAEARARVGEQSPPPVAAGSHDHEH